MKAFSKSLLALLLLATSRTLITKTSHQRLASEPKQFERYLSSLGTGIYTSIERAKARMANAPSSDPMAKLKVFTRKLSQKVGRPSAAAVRKLKQTGKDGKGRKLYESLSNSFLQGSSDDASTTNQLSGLVSEQKAMQNYRSVGAWVSDIDNNLDDLRDSINRRVSDLATGLQRRNMLLGHYNYMNAGLAGGASAPAGGFQTSASFPISGRSYGTR